LVGSALAGCDGRRGYLYHVAVAPQHRRQGVGRALVQSCLRALAREGIDKSHIMVKADNAEGLVFWTHSGWSPRTDLVLMSRSTSG
jgi:ribosomal protein S18 acetylase RimI-like enzyme